MEGTVRMFKKCSGGCGMSLPTREDFLSDPEIQVVGYQVNFEQLSTGLFLFNHSCMSTIALPVSKFADLYKGEIFTECNRGNAECPGYCLHRANLHSCPARCECSFVREILQTIRNWPLRKME